MIEYASVISLYVAKNWKHKMDNKEEILIK